MDENLILPTKMQENEDGSATAVYEGEKIIANPKDHRANLALVLREEKSYLTTIGSEIKQGIEKDVGSRKEWEDLLKNSISLLGITEEKKTDPFEGCCRTYSSSFMHSFTQLISFVVGELLTDPYIKLINDRQDLSDEGTDFFNGMEQFLRKEINSWTEFKTEKDQLYFWTVLSGSGFDKTYHDRFLRRPTSISVEPKNLIVHDKAVSLETAERYTHRIELSRREFDERVATGFYMDVNNIPSSSSGSTQLNDVREKTAGVAAASVRLPNDEVVNVDECYEYRKISILGDKAPKPYITSILRETGEVLSIYKNWDEQDPTFKREEIFTHHRLSPGMGFYGWGLMHYIANQARVATGLQRQIIDSGTLSSSPSGWYSPGLKGNNIARLEPGKFIPLEGGPAALNQKILQSVAPPPSPVMLQMKNEIEQAIKQFSMILASPSEISPNAAVGTTFFILQEKQRNHQAMMSRLLDSLNREFSILEKHIKKYWQTLGNFHPEYAQYAQYLGTMVHIKSAADAKLSSAALRSLRAETLVQTAGGAPQLHNLPEIYKHLYHVMGFSAEDINKFMVPQNPEVNPPLDARIENSMLRQGKEVKAYKDQDHAAHLIVLQDVLNDPMVQQNPQAWAVCKAHEDQHAFYEQLVLVEQEIGQELPEDSMQLPPQVLNRIAQLEAQKIQQQMQAAQQSQPPAPLDPSLVLLEDVKAKRETAQERNQVDIMKVDLEKMKIQINAMQEQEKLRQRSVQEQEKLRQKAVNDQQKVGLEERKFNREASNQLDGFLENLRRR